MHFRPRCVCSCIHPFAYENAAVRTFGRAHRHRPYGFVWVDYTWMVGFVGVGLRDKILRSVVGAVPMCPPVSPCKGASIVKIPAHNA